MQGNNFVLQQDDAPTHASEFTKSFFTDQRVEPLDWPLQSPSLNPFV